MRGIVPSIVRNSFGRGVRDYGWNHTARKPGPTTVFFFNICTSCKLLPKTVCVGWNNSAALIPVSYTHLCTGRPHSWSWYSTYIGRSPAQEHLIFSHIAPMPIKTRQATRLLPVSYTHLDVYKRQDSLLVKGKPVAISNPAEPKIPSFSRLSAA